MTRENILFAIIGILLGFIVGFMLASSMSQRTAMQQATASGSTMPADHPPIGSAQGSGTPDPAAIRERVTASIQKARDEPKNFDAQIEAADLYYQIGRYNEAIDFLLKANQLRPTDYRTVTLLGMVNLDARNYDTAEKWYRAAIKMRSDDVMVLSGLAAVTLGKGDAKAAEDAIAQLEKADPNSVDLPQFRDRLASLKQQK
jgi:tetratricopeptide (TPR) repeat protein